MLNFIYMIGGALFFMVVSALLFIHAFGLEVERMAENDKRISKIRECELAKEQRWPLDCEDFKG